MPLIDPMETLLRDIGFKTAQILSKALEEKEISVEEGSYLFGLQGKELIALVAAADELRKRRIGERVTFVHNRNINFTDYCVGDCLFCGFRSKPGSNNGFLLSIEEIVDKATEADRKGATEVCIQGGLHPALSPAFYLEICESIRSHLPKMHIHAFSPMEVWYASHNMGCSTLDFLKELKSAGLSSMPGTAAEILDDAVRKIICPSKILTAQWVQVVGEAHSIGIPTSSTMMYGHVESAMQRAGHLDQLRRIQKQTGGFTEFVPLSFVYANTELYRRKLTGPGASGTTELKVHAIARIMLNGSIDNVQVSWVKLGTRLAQICLSAGASDLGGTLMEEHISRSAGVGRFEMLTVEDLRRLVLESGRIPVQRTTTYELVEGG
jgi:7,8-didemethyl-8-hydroxy-5-deazariboflavin synthase CofH subunit